MRITDSIYIVGSGDSGFSISSPSDCSVYLIDGGESCCLIDAGSGENTDLIIDNIIADGINIDKIDTILLTHGHGDHSGGAYELSMRLGAEVYAAKETAKYIVGGDQKALSVEDACRAGLYPEGFFVKSFPVLPLADGQCIKTGDITIKALYSAGHCSGHCCYLFEKDGRKNIFSGDVMDGYGRIALQAIWDCNLQDYITTLRILNQIEIDGFFPGHGSFSINRGGRFFSSAVSHIEHLLLPKNSAQA